MGSRTSAWFESGGVYINNLECYRRNKSLPAQIRAGDSLHYKFAQQRYLILALAEPTFDRQFNQRMTYRTPRRLSPHLGSLIQINFGRNSYNHMPFIHHDSGTDVNFVPHACRAIVQICKFSAFVGWYTSLCFTELRTWWPRRVRGHSPGGVVPKNSQSNRSRYNACQFDYET
jgi:hypothetical protein